MGQSTILAAGNTAATSTDIVVAAGETVTVGLFAASSATLPLGARFNVLADTPGQDGFVATLANGRMQHAITGPGTYRVSRNVYTGTAFGVYLET